ncbi:MAG: sn-glycerol-1-phosphate dehydrogenase [Tannerellaceae bacterium]|jgi:glycerol-1-phosphate dehydrogenase [NAD(P)+]|nr:sn-glycerol-1-phosphate dehydrogenase [Tannerellaceae bacterium]
MSKENVEKALKLATETNYLVIGENILDCVPGIFKQQFPGKKGVIIADPNTYRAAGEKVHEVLKEQGLEGADPFIIKDKDLLADYRYVTRIVERLKPMDAIAIAVGAGVINDLTKRANYELGRKYMCVATAASMDGYTAYASSITKDGAKISMACPAPYAVVADIAVMSKAPSRLTASGYSDLYAKIIAGADWIIADALGIESIDETSWHIVQDGLPSALNDPEGARAGKPQAIEALTEGLMLGGFAIQSLRSSRPASGSEHQFSHLWDMEHHTFRGEMAKRFGLYPNQDEQAPSHGFKVGIGVLTMTAFYERVFETPVEQMDVKKAVENWLSLEEQIAEVRNTFNGTDIEDFAVEQVTSKYIGREELEKQLNTAKENWPEIKARLQKQVIPYEETKRRLKCVGAPTECEEIGISKERLKASFKKNLMIRSRFTVLDFALRAGYLEQWVEQLFDKNGWLNK